MQKQQIQIGDFKEQIDEEKISTLKLPIRKTAKAKAKNIWEMQMYI